MRLYQLEEYKTVWLHIGRLLSNVHKHEVIVEQLVLSIIVLLLDNIRRCLDEGLLRARPDLRSVVRRWKQQSQNTRLILRPREMHCHNRIWFVFFHVDWTGLDRIILANLIAQKQIRIAFPELNTSCFPKHFFNVLLINFLSLSCTLEHHVFVVFLHIFRLSSRNTIVMLDNTKCVCHLINCVDNFNRMSLIGLLLQYDLWKESCRCMIDRGEVFDLLLWWRSRSVEAGPCFMLAHHVWEVIVVKDRPLNILLLDSFIVVEWSWVS